MSTKLLILQFALQHCFSNVSVSMLITRLDQELNSFCLARGCCNVTVDSATTASQNGACTNQCIITYR